MMRFLQDNAIYYAQSRMLLENSYDNGMQKWEKLKIITSPNMLDHDFEKLEYKFLISKYHQFFDKERFSKSNVEFH